MCCGVGVVVGVVFFEGGGKGMNEADPLTLVTTGIVHVSNVLCYLV